MPKLQFFITVNEGSAYEIGLEKGRMMAEHSPEFRDYLLEPQEGGDLSEAELERRLELLESACPGLRDELRGFAEGLEVPLGKLYQFKVCVDARPRACSLFAVPASASSDGHAYLARSYEYSEDDELIYNVTREDGKYKHLGFSLFQIGRFDGINEKGLCVAIASCECVRSSAGLADGVGFPVVVRRLLDSCTTVEEALAVMLELPITGNTNYALVDASGDAAVVETLATERGVNKVIRRAEGPVYAFNHYISEENRALAPTRKLFSYQRELLSEKLIASGEPLGEARLLKLLTDRLPEGLCCHDFKNWFGTLHSMLFDATSGKVSVCFGPPDVGEWFEADLDAPVGFSEKTIDVAEIAFDNKYWELA